MTRTPLARRGTKVARAIAMINEGKTRDEVVEALGLKNDFTYYSALRKIKERRREYAANRSSQPEMSDNHVSENPEIKKGGPLRFELHLIDHRGNTFKLKAASLKELVPLILILSEAGQ
jgi:hypothetical protein